MAKTVGFIVMRAQPLHEGHIQIIEQALQTCDRLVILLGSVNRARSFLNPWTFEERRARIVGQLEHVLDSIKVYPLNDYKYSDAQWLGDVNMIITSEVQGTDAKAVIYGHTKPGNDYLKLFKEGTAYKEVNSTTNLSATEIREGMYEQDVFLPLTGGYRNLPEEAFEDRTYFLGEAKRFENYPYKETLNFNCADAVIECDGYVLLIQRGRAPGKGAWALPGGFKNANETFIQCAIRETDEEVNLRIPRKVLEGSIVATRLFDAPDRGQGIPRNTLAVHFRVKRDADGRLPRIAPADDAMHAEWVLVNDAMNEISMYDDHQDIISTMLNVQAIPAHLNSRFQ